MILVEQLIDSSPTQTEDELTETTIQNKEILGLSRIYIGPKH